MPTSIRQRSLCLVFLLVCLIAPLPAYARTGRGSCGRRRHPGLPDGALRGSIAIISSGLAVLSAEHAGALVSRVDVSGARTTEQALAPLETLHDLRPNDLDVQYQLGGTYFALARYDQAEPLLEEAFRRQPDLDHLGYYVGFLVPPQRLPASGRGFRGHHQFKSRYPSARQLLSGTLAWHSRFIRSGVVGVGDGATGAADVPDYRGFGSHQGSLDGQSAQRRQPNDSMPRSASVDIMTTTSPSTRNPAPIPSFNHFARVRLSHPGF